MNHKTRTLIVALEEDYRVDDLKDLVRAISLLSGVLKVEVGQPVTSNDWATEHRVRRELIDKLFNVLYKEEK